MTVYHYYGCSNYIGCKINSFFLGSNEEQNNLDFRITFIPTITSFLKQFYGFISLYLYQCRKSIKLISGLEGLAPTCVGCGGPIHDQFILRVSPDLSWHAACLKVKMQKIFQGICLSQLENTVACIKQHLRNLRKNVRLNMC